MRTPVLLLAPFLLVACGGRSPTGGGDASARADRGAAEASVPGDGLPARDACVRPPGGCFSAQDCKQGEVCEGCGPDPCCPLCTVCYGRCVPSTAATCATNGECKPGAFCNLDGICKAVGGKAGTCEERPQGCPDFYSPVCGCNGKVYGNSCEAHSEGVSVKQIGPCPETCANLEQAYQSMLTAAKSCCPTCKSIQCAKKVKSELACPCETYVHEPNAAALQTLAKLEAEWSALGCGQGIGCPPLPCPPLTGSTCKGTGTVGTCADSY